MNIIYLLACCLVGLFAASIYHLLIADYFLAIFLAVTACSCQLTIIMVKMEEK